MENLSDDDFRSYMNDFQSYLHNISDIGPIEPSSLPAADDVTQSPPEDPGTEVPAADSSYADWSAMSNQPTGSVEVVQSQEFEEDDEDRIVAEGCDLDCEIKNPDLIPTQTHSGWYPDVAGEEEDREELGAADGSSVDPDYELRQELSTEDQEWQVETLKPSRSRAVDEDEDWQVETLKPKSRTNETDFASTVDQAVEEVAGGCMDEEDQSSPAVEQKTSWKYFGDDQTLQFYEQSEAHGRQTHESDLKRDDTMTSDEEINGGPTGGAGFSNGEPNAPTTWPVTHEVGNNEEEEDLREDLSSDEDHFALDRSQTATLVKSNRTSVVHDEVPTTFNGTQYQADDAYSQRNVEDFGQMDPEVSAKESSGYYHHEVVPDVEDHYGAAHHEQEATGEDRLNSNVTEARSEVKQNGAQLRIYPSQVRKANDIFPTQSPSETSEEKARRNGCQVQSPGETGNEEEGRELPEQGSVKTLLAQWRQMEQRKKSQAEPEQDFEIQPPTRSRVRDEILRMRSQSCDPMASRRHSRLSPNDDDVPTVGARVGRGRSRGTEKEEEEQEDGDEHYRSQPSLTKAIMAKFENLDLQANSTIQPKTSKNFKWQVKENPKFCRPGFQPRSGR